MADPVKGKQDVTTTSVAILAANTLRNGVILTNEGTDDVWLGYGEDAVAAEGMKVPAGGNATLHYGGEPAQGYNQFIKAINGITASGTSSIAYQEI